MTKTLRAAIAAAAIGAMSLSATNAHAAMQAPVAAAASGITVPQFLAGAYVFGFAFCTAFAFGKQTAANQVGPQARMEAVADCLLPIHGVEKWKHR